MCPTGTQPIRSESAIYLPVPNAVGGNDGSIRAPDCRRDRHLHRGGSAGKGPRVDLPDPGQGRRRHDHARRRLGLDRGRREGGAAHQDGPRQRRLLLGRGRRQAAQ
eukprot:scaffold35271_cov66-Phaeocystis_antarctica.AAC.2